MPNNKNGKICYLELPATDVAKSASFYAGALKGPCPKLID